MSHEHNLDADCDYCHAECCSVCFPVDDDFHVFCSEGCRENYNECAYQRQIEDYYGGDGPSTAREQQIKAYEGKYGVGGTHR